MLKGFSAIHFFFWSFVGNVFVDLSNKIFFTQHPHLNYTLYHYHLLGLFGTTGHAEPLVQKYSALNTTLRLPRRQIPRILISTVLWTKPLASTLMHSQFGKSTQHICLVPFLQYVLGTLDYLEGIN